MKDWHASLLTQVLCNVFIWEAGMTMNLLKQFRSCADLRRSEMTFVKDLHLSVSLLAMISPKRPSWMLNIITTAAAAAAKLLQSCPTLCDPIDGSPPGSPVPGILQTRTLEWVAISFFNAWKWKVKVKLLSCVWLLATPWIAASPPPPSVGFSRQKYWSGVPLPSLHYYHRN